MEWISKLVSFLKIPTRVLIPALWLFSGFMVFSSKNSLVKLNIYEWSEKNGFVFGLAFLITSCLLFVYVILFIHKQFKNIWFKQTLSYKTAKAIYNYYSDKEYWIIIELYNSYGCSKELDYADPVVKGLLAKDVIYMGNNVPVSFVMGGQMPVRFTLQPYVRQALDWKKNKDITYKKRYQRKIENLEKSKFKKKQQRIADYKSLIKEIDNDLENLGYTK